MANNPDVTRKLRALWTLHVTNGLTEVELRNLLSHESEYLRSWAIQLLTEDKSVSAATLERFVVMAKNDNSSLVRLYLAAGMQRLTFTERWEVLDALVQKAQDADDLNIPLMLWYAAEPLAAVDAEKALTLAEKAKIPKFMTYMIQRVGAINTSASETSLKKLSVKWAKSGSHERHSEMVLIEGILAGEK